MWICNCGTRNGGTNKHCAAIQQHKYQHYQVSVNSPDWVMAAIAAKGLNMTPDEELFAKFYNHEKVLVKDMDHIQLTDHRAELSKIAFEARARLTAADDEARERKAKTNNKEWLATVDRSNAIGDKDVTNAINAVAKRKERMSKMDKLTMQLRTAGIDEETIKEMVKNLEAKATDSKLKTVTFNKPTVEVTAVQVAESKPANGEPKQVFDPSQLKFG